MDFMNKGINMKSIEIYFSDLNEEAQERLCKELDTTPEDENWDMDIVPLFIYEREDD